MSLKGDLWTLRNGRCTSEISVFNYPEHLNPFYEEDNHKRLRFWKINKNIESRRRSFSFVGLKDIWGFKSLASKKKSSTLGINKTSESPPMFRKTFDSKFSTSNDFLNTSGKQCRYSTEGSPNLNSTFERNGLYRNTLTHINQPQNHSKLDTVFKRNAPSRSTYQVGDGLSAIQRDNNKEFSNNTLSRGSSVISCGSTNPFECNEEEVRKKTKKKKSRAPAPPIQNTSIRPSESIALDQSRSFGHEEIVNLTAEIVDFVENSKSINKDSVPNSIDNTTTNNINISSDGKEEHAISGFQNSVEEEVGRVECINIHENKVYAVPRQKMRTFHSNPHKKVTGQTMFLLNKDNINTLQQRPSTQDEFLADNTNKNCSESTDESKIDEIHPMGNKTQSAIYECNDNNLVIHEGDSPSEVDTSNDYISEPLKITESSDNILVLSNVERCSQLVQTNEFPKESFSSYDPWKKSSLAPLQSNIPPEKRRSVQEIIESINRNQRLLSFSRISTCINANNSENPLSLENNFHHNSAKIKNNELFVTNSIQQNSSQSRESSPTNSNLDWNPLPKPKRTKNLYDI